VTVSKFLRIGTVGKAFGIRGAFFVSGRDEPLEGVAYKKLLIGEKPDTARVIEVARLSWQQERPVVTSAQIESRTEAEALTGLPIWIDASLLEVDDEAEYLWSDLVGRQVVGSDGEELGQILAVRNYGASDVIEIQRSSDFAVASIPMVPAWVNMGFRRGEGTLHLVVPGSHLAELWEQRRGKSRSSEQQG
jgi:16S rRNA processing protein RimM